MGSGTTTIIDFDPVRSDGRGGDAIGGNVGGRHGEEHERTPPESPMSTIRPQRLFHEDNDACMELSRILDFSSTTRAAPQDAAEDTRER